MALGTGQRGRGAWGPRRRGGAGGRLPRWRSAWSKGNGYGGAQPWAAALCGARRHPALAAHAEGQPSVALHLRPSTSAHGFFSTKGNTVFLLHH
jgi:hypothetical protein